MIYIKFINVVNDKNATIIKKQIKKVKKRFSYGLVNVKIMLNSKR